MKKVFITGLTIEKVRHLENLQIGLSKDKLKHLIITGKNGSGKTSLLDVAANYLNAITTSAELAEQEKGVERSEEEIKNGISLEMSDSLDNIRTMFEKGELVFAYYKADRVFQAEIPTLAEKIELKTNYFITETPRQNFVKYLLDLRMTMALADSGGKIDKADKIRNWFSRFEALLQRIYEDETLKLEFDEDTWKFSICAAGREPFDFNTLSSGYAAILDIVVDLIIRMEKRTNKNFNFNMPGVVLIDEIETHLHLELQKKVLDLLTTIFPCVQFIVSTHSPFILNSLEGVVIYDLERHLLVENGLADIPYEGIVEGYFQADTMSELLREKYERYKTLVQKINLSDDDFEEIAKLEMFLEEIPDYLALNVTTDYRRLKLYFESREDIR